MTTTLRGTAEPGTVHGVLDAATAALQGGLRTVSRMHAAIAAKPFAALRFVPGIREASEGVRFVHDGLTALVYAGASGSLAAIGAAARLGAGVVPAGREPHAASAGGMAVAALNGFAGDRLERAANPLATTMHLRDRHAALAPTRAGLAAAFPSASPRVVVFAHGLACNEAMWWRHAERHYGDASVSYGTRLERDLGVSALYLRYNSGLPIAENGRRLAALLADLTEAWPVAIEELVLVGHSMGGLVLRSAVHHAAEHAWVRRVRHVFHLGTPHRGAPLEKATNAAAWLLGRFDVTRPLAEAINERSRGIKDLRFGALRDEDWHGTDVDALLDDRSEDLPLLEGATHYFVAATVTPDHRHPLGLVMGDLLVRPASAFGRARHLEFPLSRAEHVGAMTHLALLNHPAVYEHMHRALSAPPQPASAAITASGAS